jgi:hypothetical protein
MPSKFPHHPKHLLLEGINGNMIAMLNNSGACQPPNCLCPSTSPPGNLDPKKIPQFITLTFDDSVNEPLWKSLQTAISNRTRNPNGCPLSATFFISTQFTDYSYVQGLFSSGHEIATHTMNHVFPTTGEINGAYTALNAYAGVPRDKIRGFRTPFLNFVSQVRN